MGTYHPYLIDEETNELRGQWLVQGQLEWLKTSQAWSPGLFTPHPKSVNPQHIPVCPRPSQERLTPENRAWWPGIMDNRFLFALDHHKRKKNPENSSWWAGPTGTPSASSASTTWHLLLSRPQLTFHTLLPEAPTIPDATVGKGNMSRTETRSSAMVRTS